MVVFFFVLLKMYFFLNKKTNHNTPLILVTRCAHNRLMQKEVSI